MCQVGCVVCKCKPVRKAEKGCEREECRDIRRQNGGSCIHDFNPPPFGQQVGAK